mgnify:CR=1 FL=1
MSSPLTFQDKHVLIVDDNPINRTLAAAFTKRLGITSDQAADGATALALIAAFLASWLVGPEALLIVLGSSAVGFGLAFWLKSRGDRMLAIGILSVLTVLGFFILGVAINLYIQVVWLEKPFP